jgi:hypothetical protein
MFDFAKCVGVPTFRQKQSHRFRLIATRPRMPDGGVFKALTLLGFPIIE